MLKNSIKNNNIRILKVLRLEKSMIEKPSIKLLKQKTPINKIRLINPKISKIVSLSITQD